MISKQLAMIVAATPKGEIGYQNTLPWHLEGDLARFKALTMGQVVLMGRKTYESLPKPLKGRHVIVVSATKAQHEKLFWLARERGEIISVATSLDAAIVKANDPALPGETVFVAGGAGLYEETLRRLKPKLYLTAVFKPPVRGDKYDTVIKNFDLRKFRVVGEIKTCLYSTPNGREELSHLWINYEPIS